jgi:HSP20 family protein
MLTRWYQVPTHPIEWSRPLFRPSLFDDVFENFFSPARSVSAGPRFTTEDRKSDVLLTAEVPGLSREDIQISFESGALTISGERKLEAPEGYRAHTRERMPFRFSRTFDVSEEMEMEKAEAKIENGLLTLTIPLRPQTQPRQIPIKAS